MKKTKSANKSGNGCPKFGYLSFTELATISVEIGSTKGSVITLTPLESPVALYGHCARARGYNLKTQHSYEQTLIVKDPATNAHLVTIFKSKRIQGCRVCLNTVGTKRETWADHYPHLAAIFETDVSTFKDEIKGDTGYLDVKLEKNDIDKFNAILDYAHKIKGSKQPSFDSK